MDLKTRKYINANNVLPHYLFGKLSNRAQRQWMEDELDELLQSNEADIDPKQIGGFLNSGVSGGIFSKDNLNKAATKGVGAAAQAAAVPVSQAVSGFLSGGKESATGDVIGGVAAAGLGAAGSAIGGPIGGAIGAVVGEGIGGIFSGLFGSDPEEERRRQLMAQANERYAKERQDSDKQFLEEQTKVYNQGEGRFRNPVLFGGAALGKPSGVNISTGETYDTYMVNTPYGKLPGKQNSWVSKGEVIMSKDGSMYKVKSGKNDTARASLSPSDIVFSNKVTNPQTGNKIAKDVPLYAKYGMLDELERVQELGKIGMKNKNSKLPKMGLGGFFDGNLFSTLFSLDAARKQYRMANEPLRRTEVYEPNQQFSSAMQDLDSLYLPYRQFALQNLATERRLANNIRKSAGLGAGQKARAYSQLSYNTQKNNSATLMLNILQNNTYRAAAAQARMAAGQDAAKMRMQANMFNEEMLAKAHNAAVQGKNMSLFNTINAMQQYYANQFKKNQFDRTLALYQQELDERAKDRDAMYGNNKKSNTAPVGLYSLPLFSKQARSLLSRQLYPSILPTLDEINSLKFKLR